MERQRHQPVSAGAAREQLRVARNLHDGWVRRATPPVGVILAASFFCGAQTVPAAQRGPAGVLTAVAVAWLLVELLRLSARNRWHALRSMPGPNWSLAELALIATAVLVGAVIGPHLLASGANPAVVSWGIGGAVAAVVAALLFAASAAYRRRSSRAWPG